MKDRFLVQLSLAIGICAVSLAFIFKSFLNSSYVMSDVWDASSAAITSAFNKAGDVLGTLRPKPDTRTMAAQHASDSFSDEVIVRPDPSGTSGVIVPVFKTSRGDEYNYVLTPSRGPEK